MLAFETFSTMPVLEARSLTVASGRRGVWMGRNITTGVECQLRMMNQPPRQYPVSITRRGIDYHGTFELSGSDRTGWRINVSYRGSSKTAWLRTGHVEDARSRARIVLGELVSECGPTQ
jgi:hypothetical protein